MKTSELKDLALDWVVTKCEGYDHEVTSSEWGVWGWATDWAQGGPLIEREGIDICTSTHGGWIATLITDWEEGTFVQSKGDTCLIAAMRCYVTYKLGDSIDIPEELK